jgi:CRISPR/Cas system CSM-associated protein Csm2 small subunit
MATEFKIISIVNSVEDYAKRWTKPEKELDSFVEWIKSIIAILKSIKHVRSKMRTIYPSSCNKPEVKKSKAWRAIMAYVLDMDVKCKEM